MSRPIGISTRAFCTAALGALFVLCWSSGFVGAKLAAGDAAVPTILMWRFLPLVAVLVPVAVVARRRSPQQGGVAGIGPHLLIGLLSQVGYLVTVYWAIDLGVSTGTTALVDGVQPLVVAALLAPLLGTAASGRQWAGLALGTVGVVLVTGADAASPSSQAPAWAYLVPVVGMLSLVAATFVQRRTMSDGSRLEVLTVHCTVSAVVFTAVALLTGTAVPPASAEFWVAQLWLVVLATFGGYGLYWLLVERVGVAPTNSLLFLIAPVTSVWGALMFGEPFTVVTTVGLALALVAALAVTGNRREPAVRSADAETVVGDEPSARAA